MLDRKNFESRDELTAHFAKEIIGRLEQDVDAHGVASLAVSGGRTPVDLFKALSTAEIDWSKVVITLVDERWVEPTDDASNEKLVRQHLLVGPAASATFIAHKTGHGSAFDAIESLNIDLGKLPEIFTVVILGMGEDGHTASFFPGAETLPQCLDTKNPLDCCATTPLTAPFDRVTLTLNRVLKSRWIVLHLTGDAKVPVLENALTEGAVDAMPVRSVLKQSQVPVSIYFAS